MNLQVTNLSQQPVISTRTKPVNKLSPCLNVMVHRCIPFTDFTPFFVAFCVVPNCILQSTGYVNPPRMESSILTKLFQTENRALRLKDQFLPVESSSATAIPDNNSNNHQELPPELPEFPLALENFQTTDGRY